MLIAVQYLPILLFFIVVIFLAVVLTAVPFFLSRSVYDKAKLSQYECGFEALNSKESSTFDVRFYLVSILFIVFDLEIAFLFPWSMLLNKVGILGFSSMMMFLLILTVGFVYEWKKGALDWE